MSAVGPTPSATTVHWMDQRKHLPAVVALEEAAARDPVRYYAGTKWAVAAFRAFLQGGAGLVAVAPGGEVTGFAVYSRVADRVAVAKLVAPDPAARAALLAALEQTRRNCAVSRVILPFVLDFS